MIAGIGMDLIEIARVTKACENHRFLNRIFTLAEQELIEKDPKKAAGCFAVKEAVVKVFGTGFVGCQPVEIEVLRNKEGKPFIKLYGRAKKLAEQRNITTLFVTITNSQDYAAAVVVGERSG